ncbi:MAG: protein translocase subunit SecD, partial [Flavobacteriales bacterium]
LYKDTSKADTAKNNTALKNENSDSLSALTKDSALNEQEESLSEASDTIGADTTEMGVDTSDGEEGFEDFKTEEDTSLEGVEGQKDQVSEEEMPLFYNLQPNVRVNRQNNTRKLSEGPVVGFAKVTDTSRVNELLDHKAVEGIFPQNLKFMWGASPQNNSKYLPLYAIKVTTRDGEPRLDGEVIVEASQDYNNRGQVIVSMQMNSEGASIWKNMTGENVGKAIAIVMDNNVYSAPIVQSEIPSGRSQITVGGSGNTKDNLQEAKDLANLLKAGALPVPTNIVDESVVGPSLGQENIDAGLMSFIIALIVILFYMVFYYSGAGLVSDIALIANLFFLIGALASLQAALTLPGIAGIVLTIGIAVDANVLIFERVKEELRRGKKLNAAITEGYRKAYAAIVDANVTTLLTAIILVSFGSGPVKGFAVTLIIGIFPSLFSAIFITRLVFTARLDKKKEVLFSNKITKNAFQNMNISFLSKRKIFYVFSGVLIVIGIFSFATKSFNLGVEFVGGRTYTVQFDEKAKVNKIRKELGKVFVSDKGVEKPPRVKTIGNENQVRITTKYLINDNSKSAGEKVRGKLHNGLSNVSDNYEIKKSRKVDPSISEDIKASAFWAVLFSMIAIFLYIMLRFRKWQYGLGALIAVTHDVVIVLTFFSLLYGLLPFSLEIDQAFIAAILTVVGYSINDTVVVYDRIREYLKEYTKKNPFNVINSALNSTLSRTFNTSMSTFVVLLTIFILGSESIRGFSFGLMIGVIIGTYSSLFVATPVIVDFTKGLVKKDK